MICWWIPSFTVWVIVCHRIVWFSYDFCITFGSLSTWLSYSPLDVLYIIFIGFTFRIFHNIFYLDIYYHVLRVYILFYPTFIYLPCALILFFCHLHSHCIPNNVFETMINTEYKKNTDRENIIINEQCRFREKHTTVNQLISMIK